MTVLSKANEEGETRVLAQELHVGSRTDSCGRNSPDGKVAKRKENMGLLQIIKYILSIVASLAR